MQNRCQRIRMGYASRAAWPRTWEEVRRGGRSNEDSHQGNPKPKGSKGDQDAYGSGRVAIFSMGLVAVAMSIAVIYIYIYINGLERLRET